MNNTWLQYAPTANKFKQTYVRGFMDISGNTIIRNGGLNIVNGNINIGTNLDVNANGRIKGNLTTDHTIYAGSIDISNSVSGPGLVVRQFANQPIATFYSDNAIMVSINDSGDVSMNRNLNVGGNLYLSGSSSAFGITKSMVGLGSADNTSDANKPVSTAQQTALDLKSNLASPTFTGTVTAPATSITNTTVATSTSSGALQIAGGVGIGGNLYVGGTTVGITSTMVGLGNVTNTSDANKPVSTAQQTALDLKSNLASPTFTGTVNVPTMSITNTTISTSNSSGALVVSGGAGIGGSVNIGGNTRIVGALTVDGSLNITGNVIRTDIYQKVQISEQVDISNSGTGPGLTVRQYGSAAIAEFFDDATSIMIIKDGGDISMNRNLQVGGTTHIKASTVSTSTSSGALQVVGGAGIGGNLYVGGTTVGITSTMVGLGNVTNTSDANKPVSTAQQTALDLKANLASPTFTGTVGGITSTMVGLGNVTNTSDANKPVSTAQQTALDLKANLASPTFTGTVGGITSTMVGLGNVTNTSDANKPVSTAQQTALDLKANLASPTFTGTVGGITSTMVGLGNVTNTSDSNKPVSTAQQTALNLKSNLASPTFTGTVTAPATSITNATPATSTSSGALKVTGGIGVGENAYVGGNIYLGAGKGVYVNNLPLSSGGGMTNTLIDFSNDITTSNSTSFTFLNTEFYAIEIISPTISGAVKTPIDFFITGESLLNLPTFQSFDTNNNGFITFAELRQGLINIGMLYTDTEVTNMIIDYDIDGDGQINSTEFVNLITPINNLKTFQSFDTNNNGVITFAELRQGLINIGKVFTDTEVYDMISAYDMDGDGQLISGEFIPLIEYVNALQPSPPTNDYNEVTLYGTIRPGGNTDHSTYYEYTQVPYASNVNTRFYAIYEAVPIMMYYNIVIFVRGGYKYNIQTNGTLGYYLKTGANKNGVISGTFKLPAAITATGTVGSGVTATPLTNAQTVGNKILNTDLQNMNKTIRNNGFIINNSTASTSTSTGALVVAGGAGIGGNAYIGGVQVSNLAGTGTRSVYSTAAGYLTNTSSDVSLKTNIEPIDATQTHLKILQLQPKTYQWIDTEKYGTGTEIGLIAQEVIEHMPELVWTGNDDKYGLLYERIPTLLLQSVKELQRQIDELNAEIAILKPM